MAATWSNNKQVNFEANVPQTLTGIVRIEPDDHNLSGRYSKTPFSNTVKGFKIPNDGVAFKDGGENVIVKFSANCSIEVGYA